MNECIAVIRAACPTDSPALLATTALDRVRGVAGVIADVSMRELRVRFDRTMVSLGDLVHVLEAHGVRVGSVSQSRGAAAVRSATA